MDEISILNMKVAAVSCSLSVRQLHRLIANGDGPIVTHLSSKRVGIAREDLAAWLASRRRPRPTNAA